MTHTMAAPIDRRTRASIENDVLQHYALQGRIDWDWCHEIPSRAAAAKRLVKAGRISDMRGSRCQMIKLTDEQRKLLMCPGVEFIPGRRDDSLSSRAARCWDAVCGFFFGWPL